MDEPTKPGMAGLKLVLVLVLVIAAVAVAIISGRSSLRGPKEILVPMPEDIPYDEYLRRNQGQAGVPPVPAEPPAAPARPGAPPAPPAPP